MMLDETKPAVFVDLPRRPGMDEAALDLLLAYWNRRLLERREQDWT